jgi:hypothetical protein
MTYIPDKEKAKLNAAIKIKNGISTPNLQNSGEFKEQTARSVHIK